MNSGTVRSFALPAVLLVAAAAFGGPRPITADATLHTRLESSTPAADSTLRSPIETVVLTFNNPVQSALSSAVIDLAAGDSIVLQMRSDPADEMTLLADAVPLPAGPTRLRWTTAAADGHRVNGSFTFTVSAEAARAWAPATGASATPSDSPTPVETAMDPAEEPMPVQPQWADDEEPEGRRIVPILVSGAGSLFLLTLGGLLFFLVTARAPETLEPPRDMIAFRGALFLAALAAAILMIDVIVWARDVTDGGAGDLLAAFSTGYGRAGLARAVFAFAALVVIRLKGAESAAAAGLAFLAILAGSAAGHPAAFTPAIAVPANALHQVAAAVWAGGLAYLVVACMGDGGEPTVAAVRRVSSLALVAVIAVAATGFLQNWLISPGLAALTSTRYGQIALAKTVGLAVLVGFGAYHRFRLVPALDADADPAAFAKSVRREAWVMGIVIFLAAFLSHTSPDAG